MTAAIEVLEVRRIEGHGNLRGFAKVKLGAVVIHGCRIIQQPGRKAWVALPQQPARKKADGSGSGWFPVIEITRKELLDQVKAAILEAYEAHQSEGRIQPPVRGQGSYQAVRERADEVTGRTAVHRNERRDPRQERIEELAEQFEPDEGDPF